MSTFTIPKATAEQVQAFAQRIVAGVAWVRLALVGPDYHGEELLARRPEKRVIAKSGRSTLASGTVAWAADIGRPIIDHLEHRHRDPKPFVWTASVDALLAKPRGCMPIAETIH